MDIKRTEFKGECTESEVCDGSMGRHVFHHAWLANSLIIDGEEYHLSYQTGHDYDWGNYNYPSNSMTFYADGSHPLFSEIVQIDNEESCETETEYIMSILTEVKEVAPKINTLKKLKAVYIAFLENRPKLYKEIPYLSDDPDEVEENSSDYEEEMRKYAKSLKKEEKERIEQGREERVKQGISQ